MQSSYSLIWIHYHACHLSFGQSCCKVRHRGRRGRQACLSEEEMRKKKYRKIWRENKPRRKKTECQDVKENENYWKKNEREKKKNRLKIKYHYKENFKYSPEGENPTLNNILFWLSVWPYLWRVLRMSDLMSWVKSLISEWKNSVKNIIW